MGFSDHPGHDWFSQCGSKQCRHLHLSPGGHPGHAQCSPNLWTVTLLLSCKPLGQTGLLSTTWSAPETFLSTCTLEKMHGAET